MIKQDDRVFQDLARRLSRSEWGGNGDGSHRQPLQGALRPGNAEVLLGRNRKGPGSIFSPLMPHAE